MTFFEETMRFIIPILVLGSALAAPKSPELEAIMASPAEDFPELDAARAFLDPSRPADEVLDVQVFEFDDANDEND